MIAKVLLFAGSSRSGSLNARLVQAAAGTLALAGADVTMIALSDYPLPLYDEDLAREAMPENAVRLARMFAAHDSLFIATPEVNASLPPLLKNAIDWIGLVTSDGARPFRPFEGLVAAIGSASDSHRGVSGLQHLRTVLVDLGVLVVSEQVVLAGAGDAFGADDMPVRLDDRAMLDRACRALLDHVTPGRGR